MLAAKFFFAFIIVVSVSAGSLVTSSNSHKASSPISPEIVPIKDDASNEHTRPSSGSIRAAIAAAPSATHGSECLLPSTFAASSSCHEGERCIEDPKSSIGGRCVGPEEEEPVEDSATLFPSRDLQEECKKCEGNKACEGVNNQNKIACGSCIGDYSCFQMNHNVGVNSCIGREACAYKNDDVGSHSCHEKKSCWGATVSIGSCQCYGQSACEGIHNTDAFSSDGICPSESPSASNSPSASHQPSSIPSIRPSSMPSESMHPSNSPSCRKCEGRYACTGVDDLSKIACGSCIGIGACYKMKSNVGMNSCIGDYACYQMNGNVGENSCIGGEQACDSAQGDVGSNSCHGEESCAVALVSIGSCQCTERLACGGTSNTAFSSDGVCPSESPSSSSQPTSSNSPSESRQPSLIPSSSSQPTASNSPSESVSPSMHPSNSPCIKCKGTGACYGINKNKVGCGSCIGNFACWQMNGYVGENSCNGSSACYEVSGNVGDNSCNRDFACDSLQGDVGSNSCQGYQSCDFAEVSIGSCQCYGLQACKDTTDTALSSDGICPSESPSSQPSASNSPSALSSYQPSSSPSESSMPSESPSLSSQPTASNSPSVLSSHQPSSSPSVQPSSMPSEFMSDNPSMHPSDPSSQPTEVISSSPSTYPSNSPSAFSSHQPSSRQSVQPTSMPSESMSDNPSSHPSTLPSSQPTDDTSLSPSNKSSVSPSMSPSPSSGSCLPKARRVKLQSATGVAIQVFEVQVFSSGINVAQGKSARQSSTYRGKPRFSASKAIDGDALSFSHTESGEDCGWWELDLFEPTQVERIKILNRWCADETDPKQCLCRLSYTAVSLIDNDGKWVDAVLTGNTCGEKEWAHAFTPSSVYCPL